MLQRLKRISVGFALALTGLRTAWQQKELRRVYRFYLFGLSTFSFALFCAGSWGIFSYLEPLAQSGFWSVVGAWLLLVLACSSLLVFAPVLAFFVGSMVLPLYNEHLLFSGLGLKIPRRAAWLKQQEGLPLLQSAFNSLRRLRNLSVLLLMSFLFSLIPAVGALIGFYLQLRFSAPLITQELLEPYFEKRGFDYQAQAQASKIYQDEILGFGLASLLLLSVPLLGPFFIGPLQVAVSELVCALYEAEASAEELPQA